MKALSKSYAQPGAYSFHGRISVTH